MDFLSRYAVVLAMLSTLVTLVLLKGWVGVLVWSIGVIVGGLATLTFIVVMAWINKRNRVEPVKHRREKFVGGGFTGDARAGEKFGVVHPAQAYVPDVATGMILRTTRGYTGRIFYWSKSHDDWQELS